MSNSNYIYHGTSVGATLHIQRDGYIKPNNVGEKYPSISFTSKLDYAKYYAKAKGGNTNSIILRTKLTDKFKLSNRIRNNKGFEYITYDKIPIDQVEILHDDNWYKLKDWDLIDNKLIENNIYSKITYTDEVINAYSNQINCEAGVYLNGDIVGYVQYVLYNGELTISNIFIHPSYRRMGFASRLFKYITQENPKYKYKGSLKTDLGSKLKYKRNISLTDNKLFDRCATRLHESQNQVIIGKMEQHFKDCSKKYFKEHYDKFKYPTFKIRLNIKNAGHYLPDTNEIVLNKDMANDDMQLKSTVYHETIHYYQKWIFGFNSKLFDIHGYHDEYFYSKAKEINRGEGNNLVSVSASYDNLKNTTATKNFHVYVFVIDGVTYISWSPRKNEDYISKLDRFKAKRQCEDFFSFDSNYLPFKSFAKIKTNKIVASPLESNLPNYDKILNILDQFKDSSKTPIKEAVITTDPQFVYTILDKNKEDLMFQGDGSYEIVDKLNKLFNKYNIIFDELYKKTDDPNSNEVGLTGGVTLYDQSIIVGVDFDIFYETFQDEDLFNLFKKTLYRLISHELVHVKQLQKIGVSAKNNYQLQQTLTKLATSSKKIEAYLGNKIELMAFAREAVQEFLDVGYTAEQILKKIQRPFDDNIYQIGLQKTTSFRSWMNANRSETLKH